MGLPRFARLAFPTIHHLRYLGLALRSNQMVQLSLVGAFRHWMQTHGSPFRESEPSTRHCWKNSPSGSALDQMEKLTRR